MAIRAPITASLAMWITPIRLRNGIVGAILGGGGVQHIQCGTHKYQECLSLELQYLSNFEMRFKLLRWR
jgi:hypothetical protein